MNVIFHTMAAVAVAVIVADGKGRPPGQAPDVAVIKPLLAFVAGVVVHGVLDVIPHCYPIRSKVDVVVSLVVIGGGVLLANKGYRVLVAAAFCGNIFPDLLDLSPGILRSHLGFDLPATPKVFPWHWHQFSGSLYNTDCTASNWYHLIVVCLIIAVCLVRHKTLHSMFFPATRHT